MAAMSMPDSITLEYERARCPRCGATTVDQASALCRPERDQTGEGTCPADREDADGFLLQPSSASVAAIDAWCKEVVDASTTEDAALCEDCPPVGYPTDKTRCAPCPRLEN